MRTFAARGGASDYDQEPPANFGELIRAFDRTDVAPNESYSAAGRSKSLGSIFNFARLSAIARAAFWAAWLKFA
jgi:hypothetical protein